VGQLVAVLFGAMLVVFLVTQVLGDPAAMILPVGTPASEIHAMNARLGYSDPVVEQFVRFVWHTVQLDFGDSLWLGEPASSVVFRAIPNSLVLATVAFGCALVIGVPLGVLAAVRPRSVVDIVVSGIALVLISIADFWFGIMLIRWIAVASHGAIATSGYGIDVQHLLLPVLTTAIYPFARIISLTRASVVEQFSEPYIQTARAKGLSLLSIQFRHVLRNALIPVITLLAYDFSIVLAGSAAVTETLFSWPGVGKLAVEALSRRDFPLVQATVFISAATIALLNLVVDLIYRTVDPRVRLGRRTGGLS
jgi:peptide/nickel transport system permease protein